MEPCSNDGCDQPAATAGLCRKHHRAAYMRAYSRSKSRGPCSIEGCDRGMYGRSGLCPMHYQRRRLLGAVGEAAPRFMQKATVADRWEAKVDRAGPMSALGDRCWLWTAGTSTSGYGTLIVDGRNRGAHVISYEMHVGPIPEGLTIDHLCHTRDDVCDLGTACLHRRCVNPGHLEPVTAIENVRRGHDARKAKCKRGHDLTDPANLKPNATGRRQCRQCVNILRMERYYAERAS